MKQTTIFKKSSKGAGSSHQNPHKIIIILGPTASGKSDLAVKIAKKISAYGGGEIISADSRQVYKGLDIGSGKVPRDKIKKQFSEHNTSYAIACKVLYSKNLYFYKNIRHHLISVANPKRTFTVAQYQKLARETIQRIWNRGKLPIICGGTGFYIQSVIDGIIIPDVKPNYELRKKLEKKSANELFKSLKEKDPKRAKNIDRQNRRRLIRALEIAESLGKVPKLKKEPIKADVLTLGIKLNGEILKKRIKRRLVKRLKEGLIAEVKKLRTPPTGEGLSWKRLESFGLEYRYLSRFLQNKITREEMIEILEREIYRYAKRQMTWFKRDKRIQWIKNEKEAVNPVREFVRGIKPRARNLESPRPRGKPRGIL